jgi:hypothetical protein
MKKKRIPRKAKQPGAVRPAQKLNSPTDDAEELEAIRAYDAAKESDETSISYDRPWKRIELSRQ